MSPIKNEVIGSALWITLDSPQNRNALSPELVNGIRDGLAEAAQNDDIRTVVLSHTGNTFCAGADLSAKARAEKAASSDPLQAQQESGRRLVALLRDILGAPVPVIAHVNGHVRAGGMGIIAACDVVVCGSQTTFGLSEVRIGVVPAIISSAVLERVDQRAASDWFLTGRRFSPEEAVTAGFISRVEDDPTTAVERLLEEFRLGSPSAIARTKTLLNASIIDHVEREEERMLALSAEAFLSEEAQAGMQAFRKKEKPPWVATS